jgi:hypothetical protein
MSEAASVEAPTPERTNETRQPFDLSDEMKAKVAELDLAAAVQQVKDEGYGYIHNILRLSSSTSGCVKPSSVSPSPIRA